jgi:hypothetical protein
MRTAALVVLAVVSGAVGAQRMPDSSDFGRRDTYWQEQQRLEREQQIREEARREERQRQRQIEEQRQGRDGSFSSGTQLERGRQGDGSFSSGTQLERGRQGDGSFSSGTRMR